MKTNGKSSSQCKKQINNLDKAIDRIVYALYGLTEEEVEIVEGENTILWNFEL